MQTAYRLLSAAALALASATTFAAATIYTSSASFLANVLPGSYTENFNGLTNPPPTAFANGGFSYTVSAPNGLYASGDFLGTNQIDEALTITFTGNAVTAIGGNFYSSDLDDDFQAVSMTITLSDGTIEIFTPTSASDSYRGFTAQLPFTSLVISAPGQSLYAGLDNLTIGRSLASVPEPTSWALVALAVAGLGIARRRAA